MNQGQRQIVAEKVASTVRVLELLGLQYQVTPPRKPRKKGNRSPRVIHVATGNGSGLRVYNGIGGNTWAHEKTTGKPIAGVKSIEELYSYLKKRTKR